MKDEQEGECGGETLFSQQYLSNISLESRDLRRVSGNTCSGPVVSV